MPARVCTQRRRVERYANRSYPSSKISPTRRHEKARACSIPAARSSSRRASASRTAAAIAAALSGSARTAAVPAGVVQGRVRRRDDRRAGGHRLGDRHAEALEARWVGDDGRSAVEPGELLVADAAEPDDTGPVELRLLAPALAADDHEREPRVAEQRERLDERAEVLARLERCDREQVRPAEVGGLARRP